MWALPGFLGLPSDWDVLGWKNVYGVELNAFPWVSLSDWPLFFHSWLDSQKEEKEEKEILMGYSLGGRLALHSLLHSPQRWKAAIFISTHPGLIDSRARQERQKEDEEWARRFETQEWASLMQDWNRRAVFAKDSFCFDRREENYDRRWLAHLLRDASLAKQPDFRSQIAALPLPLLWVTGADDWQYGQLAASLIFAHPHSRRVQIEQAGHRVPWEQPEQFSNEVSTFLKSLCFA